MGEAVRLSATSPVCPRERGEKGARGFLKLRPGHPAIVQAVPAG